MELVGVVVFVVVVVVFFFPKREAMPEEVPLFVLLVDVPLAAFVVVLVPLVFELVVFEVEFAGELVLEVVVLAVAFAEEVFVDVWF